MSELFCGQFGPVPCHEDLRYALWHVREGEKQGNFDRRNGAELRILATDRDLRDRLAASERAREEAERERDAEGLAAVSERKARFAAEARAERLAAIVGRVSALWDANLRADVVKALRPHERESFLRLGEDVGAALASEARP